MSLNQITADLLAEKQAAKPEVEPRLCGCGCLAVLKRNPNEAHYRFKRRKYHTYACSVAARTPSSRRKPKELNDRVCVVCGALFNRRRYKTGMIESRQDFEGRDHCPEHTTRANGGKRQEPATTFSKDTRLPDPITRETFSHSPKDESNTKRIPSLLEQERAAGVTLEPVSIEQFEHAARRAKRYHPEFTAMLRDEA